MESQTTCNSVVEQGFHCLCNIRHTYSDVASIEALSPEFSPLMTRHRGDWTATEFD